MSTTTTLSTTWQHGLEGYIWICKTTNLRHSLYVKFFLQIVIWQQLFICTTDQLLLTAVAR